MKKLFLLLIMTGSLLAFTPPAGKVTVTNGPALSNDVDYKMNRMLGGDNSSFYCYRVRWKGKGTSFYIEKYDKATLKPTFSKEINIGNEDETRIEDVEYAKGDVYVFRRKYDKEKDKMTLTYQVINGNGTVGKTATKILDITSDHFEFVDYDIYPNPSKTKFIVKASHKPKKEAEYTTDFYLYDINAGVLTKVWQKSLPLRLFSRLSTFSLFGLTIRIGDVEYNGLNFDDNDNFAVCYLEVAKNSTDKEKRFKLKLASFTSSATEARIIELPFDDDYYVSDVEFSNKANGDVVVAGILKDIIERKGRDEIKVGFFNFVVNRATGEVSAKQVKTFDDKLLHALESNWRKGKYLKYKLDYIIPSGDNVYFIGEQYREEYHRSSNTGYGIGGGFGGLDNGYWLYEYQDVIVAKQNKAGEIEWIKNVPLRQGMRMEFKHVFKQYIAVATDKYIYILNNDHEKNLDIYKKADFEPADLKTMQFIHGSNFVYSTVDQNNGAVTHELIFANEEYCFAPIQERNRSFMPPADTEIFIPGEKNEVYIYTEDRGKDRFAKMKFE